MGRSPLLRLVDMHAAIQATFRMTEGVSRAAFEADEVLYAACMFRILVTAEAAHDLPVSLREAYPQIDWRSLINMGNLLKHQYFRIEADVVWDTITSDFLPLVRVVETMIEAEKSAQVTAAE